MTKIIGMCPDCGSAIDSDGEPVNCQGDCGARDYLGEDDYTELNFDKEVVRDLGELEPEVPDFEDFNDDGC